MPTEEKLLLNCVLSLGSEPLKKKSSSRRSEGGRIQESLDLDENGTEV